MNVIRSLVRHCGESKSQRSFYLRDVADSSQVLMLGTCEPSFSPVMRMRDAAKSDEPSKSALPGVWSFASGSSPGCMIGAGAVAAASVPLW
jgi:hypothetical protein